MNLENIILCEGYHDRAFLAELLQTQLGCTDCRHPRLGGFDDMQRLVCGRGQYGYVAPDGGRFVRIVPCGGNEKVDAEIARIAGGADTNPYVTAVACKDSDRASDEPLRRVSGGWQLAPPPRSISLFWECDDPPIPLLPDKQTLERLVCAALVAGYPERGPLVKTWLEALPVDTSHIHKSHAWSHMAGWFAASGCDDFFRAVWRDPAIAGHLRQRLERTGAWEWIASLVQ